MSQFKSIDLANVKLINIVHDIEMQCERSLNASEDYVQISSFTMYVCVCVWVGGRACGRAERKSHIFPK